MYYQYWRLDSQSCSQYGGTLISPSGHKRYCMRKNPMGPKSIFPIDRSKQWRLLKRQTRLLYLETRFIANPSLSDVFRYLGKMIKARKWRKESFLRVWHHNAVRAAVSLLVLISCVLLVWKWHEIKVTKQIMCVTEERWKVILVRMLYGSFVAEVKNFFATL